MWWEHWFDNRARDTVDRTIAKGMVKLEGGRLVLQTRMLHDPYWLHIPGSLDSRNCALWYEIFFKEFNIIHSFCRYHCWKCVTKPRTVKELIQFRNLMYVVPFVYNFTSPIPGKAGLDVRRHTDSPYAAFNYATTAVEALRIKDIMRHMIKSYLPTEKINGQHLEDTVFVKRSCTEFEQSIPGDDPWWNASQSRDEIEIQRKLEEIYRCDPELSMQPAWLCDKTIQKWLNHANSIGDKSVTDFTGADNLSVKSIHYDYKDLKPKGGELQPQTPKKKREKGGAKNKEKK